MANSIVTGGSEFQVNTFATGTKTLPVVAVLADGSFIVSWQSFSQDGSGGGIYGQRYDAAGTTLGGEFRVNTTTAGNQGAPAIAALAGGGFVVSWSSMDGDGNGYDTFAQRYDAAGVTQGGEFRINTYTTGDQSYSSATALADGGFVVSWQSFGEDGGGGGIYARRYDDDGVAQGGVFRVNTDTASNQRYPTVTGLEDGGFVFSWESGDQDGSGSGVYAQRYDAAGAAQGGEFRVNSFTTNDQGMPAIAALDGGGFAVTWHSVSQDGSDMGIYAQRYDAAGVARGGEFRVNSFTQNGQYYPSITGLDGGGFVITWESAGQDGNGYGVYAQRYDAAGVPEGGEFLINSATAGDQVDVTVAALAGGGFVAGWQSRDADAIEYDIHARIFTVSTAPIAVDDMATATEDVSTPLWHWVLMNDSDPGGDALSIVAVDTTGTHGRVVLNSATNTLNYIADTAYFDALPPGRDVIDTFTYTIADPSGETSTATVVLLVTTTTSGVVMAGTEGDDVLYGSAWQDRLDGLGGNDTIFGYEEKDTLIGGAGNDTLVGGLGADMLDGGEGRDTASYRGAAAGVTASLAVPADNSGEAAGDTYVGIENLEGSGFDDVLGGNADANDFFGGGGVDTVSYGWSDAGVVASLGNSTSSPSANTTQTGDAAGDRYNSVEILEGTDFADTLFAASGGSTLSGLEGSDMLYGLGGRDKLVGGAGQDRLIGDGGADQLYGGDDDDMLRGDAGTDNLYGEAGADRLDGGAGVDVLDGGAGDDTLTGGGGADFFVIANIGGTDTITDFKRAQGDKISLGSLAIDEWIGTQAFHNDAGEVRIRNVGADWWLEGDLNGDGIADFSVALGNVQLVQGDVMFA